MSSKPYFDVAACRLVCPPGWDGNRDGLGDIVLAMLPEVEDTVLEPIDPAGKLLEFAREVQPEGCTSKPEELSLVDLACREIDRSQILCQLFCGL